MSCDPVINMLNEQVNNQGLLQTDCDLLFFTPALCHKAKICCNVGLEILVYNRLKPAQGWRYVAGGTLTQMADTLNTFGPFLAEVDVPIFWGTIPD